MIPATRRSAPTSLHKIQFASRVTAMSPSAVREILKVADRPDVLSFAGGLPAPELFPVEAIAQAHADVLARDGRSALQYSETEGYRPLRGWIADRFRLRGVEAKAEDLLITAGSQQGIHLAARVLLEPGDTVIVEDPTYLAALQVFAAHEARMIAVPSDDDGMQVDALEEILQHERPKLIYIVTEFQNPKGTSLSLERRHKLVALAQTHGIPILEDDPYGDLRFRGPTLPPLAALDDTGLVAYLGTFSKTLAPGLRIGWMHAQGELLRACTVMKQSADLHTATLAQRAAAELLETFEFDAHLDRLRRTYGGRCETMMAALARYMPAGTRWTRPSGGLFLWVELPPGIEDRALFDLALRRNVAFVPGAPFFVGPGQHSFIRLNFSNRQPTFIEEGIRRIGAAAMELLSGDTSVVA